MACQTHQQAGRPTVGGRLRCALSGGRCRGGGRLRRGHAGRGRQARPQRGRRTAPGTARRRQIWRRRRRRAGFCGAVSACGGRRRGYAGRRLICLGAAARLGAAGLAQLVAERAQLGHRLVPPASHIKQRIVKVDSSRLLLQWIYTSAEEGKHGTYTRSLMNMAQDRACLPCSQQEAVQDPAAGSAVAGREHRGWQGAHASLALVSASLALNSPKALRVLGSSNTLGTPGCRFSASTCGRSAGLCSIKQHKRCRTPRPCTAASPTAPARRPGYRCCCLKQAGRDTKSTQDVRTDPMPGPAGSRRRRTTVERGTAAAACGESRPLGVP